MADVRPAADAQIRAEQPDDAPAIAAVVEAAFGSPVEAELVEAIRQSPEYAAEWSLVAEVDGGSELVRAVAQLVDDTGEPCIILEGSPAYYGRLGFEAATPLGIRITLPDWAAPDAAQVVQLSTHDPSVRGEVVYPPAFDAVTGH